LITHLPKCPSSFTTQMLCTNIYLASTSGAVCLNSSFIDPGIHHSPIGTGTWILDCARSWRVCVTYISYIHKCANQCPGLPLCWCVVSRNCQPQFSARPGLDIVPLHPDLQRVGSSDLASRITWVQANLCVSCNSSTFIPSSFHVVSTVSLFQMKSLILCES
jgi:hypothetical protein